VAATFRIARRFCGPTDTGNGGYTCGVIASFASQTVTVRLLRPIPLETDLAVVDRDGLLEVLHGDERVAEARPGDVGDLAPPAPPTPSAAAAASKHYAGFAAHPAPECFVCGPMRTERDGLRIFAGAIAPGVAAAPWTPDTSLDGGDGRVAPQFVWAALDCPGFAAAAPDMRSMLLGELTAQIDDRVRVGEPCVVVGWVIGVSGRKHETGTVLYDSAGRRSALARAIWIEPRQDAGDVSRSSRPPDPRR
jgi:hypothetical protein